MRFHLVMIFIIAFLFVGAANVGFEEKQFNEENNIDVNLPHHADAMFNWSNVSNDINITKFDNKTDYNMNDVQNERIINIINKNINAIGFTAFEIVKIGYEKGYTSDEGEFVSTYEFTNFVMWIVVLIIAFYPLMIISLFIYEGFKLVKRKYDEYKRTKK